jgi:tetratricopeptide (TPR) repeat protein
MFLFFYFNFDFFVHPNAAHYLYLGSVSRKEGKRAEAIKNFTEALRLYSDFSQPLINRAICYAEAGELDKAISDLTKAIQINSRRWTHLAYSGRGTLFFQQNRFEEALQDFTEAIKRNPKFALAHINRGAVLLRLKRFEEASNDSYRGIQLTRQKALAALAYNNRAYAYALLGNLPKSLEEVNRAISLDAKSIYAYGTRGHTYYLMGKYAEAMADFQQALALKPDHKFAIAGAALTQQALGNLDEAKRLWRSLIEIDEKYREADAVQQEYDCADVWVTDASRLIAAL